MYAEMLLDDPAFQNLGIVTVKSVQLTKRNIDTALRLIADLLDMERIGVGKLQLNLGKHDNLSGNALKFSPKGKDFWTGASQQIRSVL